jgi:hypothetical protein
MSEQDSSGNEPDSPSDGKATKVKLRTTGLRRFRRLSLPGWLLLLIGVAAAVAVAVLGAIALSGGGEGVRTALAIVPVVLAMVALAWPLPWFRKDPDEKSIEVKTYSVPGLDDGNDDLEEKLELLLQNVGIQATIEEERRKAFSDRAGVLLGFSGVILALIGTEAKDVFEDAGSLGSVGRPLGSWLLVAAGVMSTIAAVDALAVLLRRPTTRTKTEILASYLDPSYLEASRGRILYRRLAALVLRVQKDREANRRMRDWFNAGLLSLLAALLFLLVHLGVYLERSVEKPREGARVASEKARPG